MLGTRILDFFIEPLGNSYLWNSASDKEFAKSFVLLAQASSYDKWCNDLCVPSKPEWLLC